MSTNIPTVHTVSMPKEIERQKKIDEIRQQQKAYQIEPATDSLQIDTSMDVASQAEVEDLKLSGRSPHDSLKEGRKDLKGAFEKAGARFTEAEIEGEKIGEFASKLIDETNQQILKLQAKGGDGAEVARLEEIRDRLQASLAAYQSARLETVGTALEVQSAGVQTGDTPEEQKLWDQLLAGAEKTLGIKIAGKDIEKAQSALNEAFKKESSSLKQKFAELKTKEGDLTAQLKKAAGPEEKKKLEDQLKAVQSELTEISQKIKVLSQDFSRLNTVTENILKHQVARDLMVGIASEEKPPHIKTAPGPQTGVKDAALVKGLKISGLAALTATDTAGDSTGSVSSLGTGETGALSSTGGGSSIASDFSGTSLAIGRSSYNIKSESKKLDKLIKKLLAAAMSGNWEAIKSALIMLDKRASMTTTQMGAQTIKAMQNYEKQMSGLSKSLGKLKGKEPDYNARLAKINNEMNLYSLNRQAIANFLRDTLTMREEIANLTHSVLQKDAQIVSSISRG